MAGGKLSRRGTLSIVFLAMTAIASAAAAQSTSNYLQFYPALQQLQLEPSKFQWNGNATYLNGTAVFILTSRSAYRGMTFTGVQPSLEIDIPNRTLLQFLFPPSIPYQSLNPTTPVTINIPFIGAIDTPQLVNKVPKRDVQFLFNINIQLSTYLDKVATFTLLYQCVNNGAGVLGPCGEAAILLYRTNQDQGGGNGT
jgi:hypothetical protein